MYLSILPHSTITGKWKWLFVKGYICNSLIYMMKKFLNLCQSLDRYITVLHMIIHQCIG